MKRQLLRRILLGLTVVAATCTAACTTLLIVGHYRGTAEETAAAARITALLEVAKGNASEASALHAELDRLTLTSLHRARRAGLNANLLLLSAIGFLAGAKGLLAGTRCRAPAMAAIQVDRRGSTDRSQVKGRRRTLHHRSRPPADALHGPFVAEAVARLGRERSAVLPLLQAIQAHYRYLPEAALQRICALTEITPAQISGVASFYPQFRHRPTGEHIIRVCHGTACHVAGAELLTAEIRRHLAIEPHADTDAEGAFTVEQAACLGCCTRAPVIRLDATTFGPVAVEEATEVPERHSVAIDEVAPVVSHRNGRVVRPSRGALLAGEIRIGLGSCCVAGGSDRVHEALVRAATRDGACAVVKGVGCVGMCHRTPLVEVVQGDGDSSLYGGVAAEDAQTIVRRHFRSSGWGGRLLDRAGAFVTGRWPSSGSPRRAASSLDPGDPQVAAFVGPQVRIATEHAGDIDPTDCDEYIRRGGFEALTRCLRELTPEQAIDEVDRSGLRGRGGAGFPVGRKWRLVRHGAGTRKFVIANGDEGDPGAFMDRMLMESFPFRIVEGLAIAAYAVGAEEGYLYIRREYPLALERIRLAIEECERRGWIGANSARDGLVLKLRVAEGASAFVCGEETALIASIEGRRGTPRYRPPFPAEAGLWGCPTMVNNVETLANVPWIIHHGGEAFAALGTSNSRGTKVFALAGKIRRGGLIEVPMGMTLRQIVEDIGGGTKDGRQFKAVQIGGPSGGCIPAELADLPVDYEALKNAGAIMGSGGLVVMDDTDCTVDLARYFLTFTQSQSCGQCTPCRIGTHRMLDILEHICQGRGNRGDLQELESLARNVERSSLCGLGKTAPRPVLTTLRYFRGEYEAHLSGACPAGRCPSLIAYRVTDRCIGCTLCAQRCPANAIAFSPYERHAINHRRCTRCGICRSICPEHAVEVVTPCPA